MNPYIILANINRLVRAYRLTYALQILLNIIDRLSRYLSLNIDFFRLTSNVFFTHICVSERDNLRWTNSNNFFLNNKSKCFILDCNEFDIYTFNFINL